MALARFSGCTFASAEEFSSTSLSMADCRFSNASRVIAIRMARKVLHHEDVA